MASAKYFEKSNESLHNYLTHSNTCSSDEAYLLYEIHCLTTFSKCRVRQHSGAAFVWCSCLTYSCKSSPEWAFHLYLTDSLAFFIYDRYTRIILRIYGMCSIAISKWNRLQSLRRARYRVPTIEPLINGASFASTIITPRYARDFWQVTAKLLERVTVTSQWMLTLYFPSQLELFLRNKMKTSHAWHIVDV